MAIDWDGLANKALNTAIDVIARKVGGVQTAGIQITPSGGLSLYSPITSLLILAVAGIGIVLILKK